MNHPFNLLFGLTTPVSVLEALAAREPALPLSGLIFHLSRCGSTLIAQMLAASPRNLVISEAAPLDTALQARHVDASLSPEAHRRLVRSMVVALGWPRRGSETRYFLKLDSWHIRAWPLWQSLYPDVPWIFVYRNPVEILVSHQRKAGSQMFPQVVPPRIFGWDAVPRDLPNDEYQARVLGSMARSAVDALAQWPGGRAVRYDELPDAVPELLQTHFGLTVDAAELDLLRAAGRRDAKAGGPFAADTAAKQKEATQRLRDLAASWVAPSVAQLDGGPSQPRSAQSGEK